MKCSIYIYSEHAELFRDRLTVGRLPLEQEIGVRFPVPEPNKKIYAN